jgi:hypothetical protein
VAAAAPHDPQNASERAARFSAALPLSHLGARFVFGGVLGFRLLVGGLGSHGSGGGMRVGCEGWGCALGGGRADDSDGALFFFFSLSFSAGRPNE